MNGTLVSAHSRDTRGLTENSPDIIFHMPEHNMASSQWVYKALRLDCTMYGLKCFIAIAITKASTSHGNHSVCLFCSFALKNPANLRASSRYAYRVAPVLWFRIPASITIQSWSLTWGRTIVHLFLLHSQNVGHIYSYPIEMSRRQPCVALLFT